MFPHLLHDCFITSIITACCPYRFFVSVNCSLFPCSTSFLAVWLAVQRCQLLGSLEEFILAPVLHACYQSSLYSSYDSCSCCIEQSRENMTDLIREKFSGVCVCGGWWWRRLSFLYILILSENILSSNTHKQGNTKKVNLTKHVWVILNMKNERKKVS